MNEVGLGLNGEKPAVKCSVVVLAEDEPVSGIV
jgi:hypothetical protein